MLSLVREAEVSFPRFDRAKVQTQLAELGTREQTAFAALCAERLLPYYRWFSSQEHWGSYERLNDALGAVWRYVEGNPLTSEEYDHLVEECRALTPDTEDFDSPLTPRAMDASVAVVQALRMCVEPSERRAAEVAEVAVHAAFGMEQINAVEDLGQVRVADPAHLRALFGAGRVDQELEIQAGVLEALRQETPLDVATLRERFGLAS